MISALEISARNLEQESKLGPSLDVFLLVDIESRLGPSLDVFLLVDIVS